MVGPRLEGLSASGRSVKFRLVLVNLLLSGVVLSVALSPPVGYRTSFFSYLTPIQWLGLSAALGLLVSLCLSRTPLTELVISASLMSIALLFLPSLVTGTLYGPDSYNKAARALQVAATGSSTNLFYPALSVFSAMADFVIAPPAIWIPMVFAAGVMGPFAGVTFARIFFGERNAVSVRYLAITSILLPMGFGVWLTTRSIYHSFFLALPLVVLELGVFYLLAQRLPITKARRITLIGLVLGIGVSMYHPFAATLLLIFVGLNTFSLLRPTGQIGPALGHNHVDRGIATIAATLAVFVLFFQVMGYLQSGIVGVLASLGMGPLTTVSSGVTCVPNPTSQVSFCSEFAELIRLGLPYLLFGILTGVVGQYNAVAVGRYLTDAKRPSELFAVNGIYAFSTVMLAFKILPVFQLPIKTRALAISTFLGFGLLTWLSNSKWDTHPSLTVTAAFVAGCLGFALLPIGAGMLVRKEVPIGFLAKFVAIGALALVGFFFVGRQSPKARRAVLLSPLIAAALFLPLLYPIPAVNGVPNHTWTESDHSQTEWIERHHSTNPTYASGSRQDSLHSYLFPNSPNNHYEGSVYLLSTLTIPPDGEPIRSYPARQGRPVPKGRMNYILLSGLSSDYVYTMYRADGELYHHAGGVRSRDVERQYVTSTRIYDASEHTAIYAVPPGGSEGADLNDNSATSTPSDG